MYLGIMKPKALKSQLVFSSIIPTGLRSIWKVNHWLHGWHQRTEFRTSLVVQWLRICLPMRGTRVQSLDREGPTCRGATKPQQLSLCSRAREPQLLSPRATTTEAHAMRSPCTTTKSSPRSPQLEKACTQQRRPNAAKKEKKNRI